MNSDTILSDKASWVMKVNELESSDTWNRTDVQIDELVYELIRQVNQPQTAQKMQNVGGF